MQTERHAVNIQYENIFEIRKKSKKQQKSAILSLTYPDRQII